MALEARISPLWRKQKFFFAIFFIAVAILFAFDGAVRWPRSNVRWQAHERLLREGHSVDDWRTYAAEKGWTDTVPEREYSQSDLIGQYVIAGVFLAVGSILLAYWLTQRHRTLRVDDEAVYTPSGTRVLFTSIVGVGKKKWESKGLATVRYQEEGAQRQFIVDDYKFEADPAHQILERIEEHLLARTSTPVM